jgi:alkylation response protein AidB-like acyl-CoA dehydrogenase
METKAKWDESKKVYKLSGCKTWISNAPTADVMVVWARSDRHENAVKVGGGFGSFKIFETEGWGF